MNLAIDCRALRKRPAGVPNFLIGVINYLAVNKKEWKVYLLSNEDFHPEVNRKLKSADNVIRIIEPLPVFSSIATLWYLLKVASILKRLEISVFYSPIPNLPFNIPPHIKTMITVHDMVYKLFPETMSFGNRLINFFLHDRSIRNADKVWAVSDYTKGEIETFFPERKSRAIVVGTSIDKAIFYHQEVSDERKQQILGKYGLSAEFIITVGTLEPRKNLQFLFSLMQSMQLENQELLIVGGKGWGDAGVSNHQLPDNILNSIKFAGFVSDEDLTVLYNIASAYVSTSLNEGFCLPLLEAMTCGCPVVAAHNSGMIEVVEGGGQTVTGWDRQTWIKSIKDAISNRQVYVEKGFKKARTFNWDDVMTRVVKYIRSE